MQLQQIKQKLTPALFEKIMKFSQQGFTEENMIRAFEENGQPFEYFWTHFPLGLEELFLEIEIFLDNIALKLLQSEPQITVQNALRIRLEIAQKYKEAIFEIYAYMKKPSNYTSLLKARDNTIKKIWNFVKIDDFGLVYYSKRLSLNIIYAHAMHSLLNNKNWEEKLQRSFSVVRKLNKVRERLFKCLD